MADMQTDLLNEGIRLKSFNSGNHKVLCPRCSHSRKNKKDPCLSVTIDGDQAVYNCHHCMWSGHAGDLTGYKARPDAEAIKKKKYAKN